MKSRTALMMAAALTAVTCAAAPASAQYKSQKEREDYVKERSGKIDEETKRATDRIRDGQRGMANSGATQKAIDAREAEGAARKKALQDHLKRKPGGPN